MSVNAKVPESEPFTTKGPYCFTVLDILAERAKDANFKGFTGDTCTSCGNTANVLHAQGGWHCTCGHFNFQSYTNANALHDEPDLGPSSAVVDAGMTGADEPVELDTCTGCTECGKCDK